MIYAHIRVDICLSGKVRRKKSLIYFQFADGLLLNRLDLIIVFSVAEVQPFLLRKLMKLR
uniref:Uncharacterized protein n=1 Tax=Daphnia magna TaxID=35525 RepID=A0A0P6AUL2_9CRUS